MAASQLKNLVYYHLDNDLYDTANFLAGRLHALEPRNHDSSHLLALTYLRLRRYKAAHDSALKYGANGRHLGCAYIFAQACLHLKRYSEGVNALEKSRPLWQGRSDCLKHTETTRRATPDAAAVLTLLGKLYQAHGDAKKSTECYMEAHKGNPFVWEAFEGLCKAGADMNVEHMFLPSMEICAMPSGEQDATVAKESDALASTKPSALSTPVQDPFNTNHRLVDQDGSVILPPVKGKLQIGRNQVNEWDTPTGNGALHDDNMTLDDEPPQAPGKTRRIGQNAEHSDVSVLSDQVIRKTSGQALKRTISGHIPQSMNIPVADPPSNPRRSNRLFGQGAHKPVKAIDAAVTISKSDRETRPARTATGAKGRAGNVVGRVVSGNRKLMPPDPSDKDKLKRAPSRASEKSAVTMPTQPVQAVSTFRQPSVAIPSLERAAIDELLTGLQRLAIGCYVASRFELQPAIQAFRALPSAQRDTPYVLAQLGKAYYEMSDYSSAEECFARLMRLQPYRIEDLEVYSTVLWHLKKDTALALLSHTLRDDHYEAPQTWCVIGNAFSLAREHDQAISAFKRATQLNENFAYAWTLMGHEYISNEEYEAALYAFRKSVTADRRGFGGWYGLGKSLEKIGKYEDAERHFRIASAINPTNATLLVCIGVVLEKLRNRKAALMQYTRALQLTPSSALARFRRARVLMHLKHFDQALAELEMLRDQAPDEANVWFLLGKCYKGLGDRGEALRAFTTALNLDVKASPFIREAMENLEENMDDEVSSSDDD